ncbi:putative tail protein [Klebsiella phage vB_KpnS_Uniso31]|uniref:Tail protein n=1 Tax=Klebsiella phage vB_KpnS_Uniso31 TaxID=2951200 RepID=A0A9E7SYT6_9CAUD|nr:putative tail protein [Klebsiella phage vB_KpnS_Uniso31]
MFLLVLPLAFSPIFLKLHMEVGLEGRGVVW